jgi:hypothetical protein
LFEKNEMACICPFNDDLDDQKSFDIIYGTQSGAVSFMKNQVEKQVHVGWIF